MTAEELIAQAEAALSKEVPYLATLAIVGVAIAKSIASIAKDASHLVVLVEQIDDKLRTLGEGR